MRRWLAKLRRHAVPPDAQLIAYSDDDKYWLIPLYPGWQNAGWPFAYLCPVGSKDFSLHSSVCTIKVIECDSSVWFLDELHTNIEHRRRGLATVLINHVIKAAREAGVRWVIGFAMRFEDSDPNLNLFDWYAARGFKRAELRRPGLLPHNIVLPLNNQTPHGPSYTQTRGSDMLNGT